VHGRSAAKTDAATSRNERLRQEVYEHDAEKIAELLGNAVACGELRSEEWAIQDSNL
jgi:hypothetical protein